MSPAEMPVQRATRSGGYSCTRARSWSNPKVCCGDVVGVEQVLADDDVHHAEGERDVGAGIDGQIPVGAGGGAGAVRIDDHQLGAVAARFLDEGPEVDVVAVDVRAPGDDVARVRELLRLGAELGAVHRLDADFPGDGADGAVQLRGAQAMKEAAVHGRAVEHAERAAVGVRKNGFGAVLARDLLEAGGDFVERFVPGDALEILLIAGA